MWHGFSRKFHFISHHKWTPVCHWNSISFYILHHKSTAVCRPNPHQIPWRFHVIYPGFFVFYAGTWHGFWTSSSHGISLAFSKKIMGFPVQIWGDFRPNYWKKDMRQSMPHFVQGSYYLLYKINIVIIIILTRFVIVKQRWDGIYLSCDLKFRSGENVKNENFGIRNVQNPGIMTSRL